ncbi:MAG: S-methyl-5-thioribose-1-phosphate isomerase, partial [Candidatus Gastranaerophilales bacterium]|nr:S-methyl-5-thioribose-1-phosphate isomerase [Candidatus Gastranaerophilales bacterium]
MNNFKIKPIIWENDEIKLLDQRKLPAEFKIITIYNYLEMADAIKTMIVRGAPAIGVSGAFGVYLGAKELVSCLKEDFLSKIFRIADEINSTRPTAVNLKWAIDRQLQLIKLMKNNSVIEIVDALKNNAIKILNDDIEINKKIGDNGSQIVPRGATILTHCNAGALATAGYGTALGVVRSAYAKDNTIRVFADEARPRQQGARLTTLELIEDGIPTTLITDGMGAYFMSKGMIDVVIVGADRIAANGETANKIGTFTVAVLAKEFG